MVLLAAIAWSVCLGFNIASYKLGCDASWITVFISQVGLVAFCCVAYIKQRLDYQEKQEWRETEKDPEQLGREKK